jgi:putative tryptophan/tyrosine transport system substrate-binding protein
MMDRRRFLLTSVAGALTAPIAAEAQQSDRVYRVGLLSLNRRADSVLLSEALQLGLRDRGYVQGRNLVLEFRSAEGRVERLPAVARELVQLRVDLILAPNNPQATAAKQATATIPIVIFLGSDPVGEGLVTSLARPGGNITGLTGDVTPETWGKALQILKEVAPKISRAAVLSNSTFQANGARWKPTQAAASQLGVTLISAPIEGPEDLERAFANMAQKKAEGLLVFTDPITYARRSQMVELAAKSRLPAIYPWREAVHVGGLLSYGPDFRDLAYRAGAYVDKILKGAKPGDLPIEQPSKFELVINPKTARALGLTIPPSLLARADQVIE